MRACRPQSGPHLLAILAVFFYDPPPIERCFGSKRAQKAAAVPEKKVWPVKRPADRARTGSSAITKAPNPVDRHVGSRVRMRRMLVGMSQEKLGDSLGITFQQIQKYEKGTNRIGASRLHQIARVLGVPIEFFYEGAPQMEGAAGLGENPSPSYVADFLSTAEGIELMKAFISVEDSKVRRRIVDLAKALANAE